MPRRGFPFPNPWNPWFLPQLFLNLPVPGHVRRPLLRTVSIAFQSAHVFPKTKIPGAVLSVNGHPSIPHCRTQDRCAFCCMWKHCTPNTDFQRRLVFCRYCTSSRCLTPLNFPDSGLISHDFGMVSNSVFLDMASSSKGGVGEHCYQKAPQRVLVLLCDGAAESDCIFPG